MLEAWRVRGPDGEIVTTWETEDKWVDRWVEILAYRDDNAFYLESAEFPNQEAIDHANRRQ